MRTNNKKVILTILDGWGVAPPSHGNAIQEAHTPIMDMFERNYFSRTLQASGIAVGLPWGNEGNSEVGHINLGAGRIVYQYLPRIVEAIRDESFYENQALKNATEFVKKNNSTLHIMGLMSSGNVHSYVDHLYALLELGKRENVQNVVLHVFTDGKDSAPNEGATFIQNLQERLQKQESGRIATVSGRAYSMDRNKNWHLTQKAYQAITQGLGESIWDPVEHVRASYENGFTDLDIPPAVVFDPQTKKPVSMAKEGDAVIYLNFRGDSARQLTQAFTLDDMSFSAFQRKKIKNLYFVTMTNYQEGLPVDVAFPPPNIENSLSEAVSRAGKRQLHVAETEKYAHVTYFFNGEKETSYEGEERILLPSKGTPHYENAPEMQAYNITQKVLENMKDYDFILVNFANADMVAHTGDFEAAKKAIETIDVNLSNFFEISKRQDVALVITADHGNAEAMRDLKTGEVKTKHTDNPVPFFVVDNDYIVPNQRLLYQQNPRGMLADVAPTVLKLMGVQKPKEMTGKSLI